MKRTRDMADHELLEALLEVDDGLSDREVSFVESLGEEQEAEAIYGGPWQMTPRQRVKAEEILDKIRVS